MDKQTLRREIKERFRHTDDAQRAEWSSAACSRIASLPQLEEAKVVMAFYPLRDEVDIRGLIKQLAEQGKQVLLPEVVDDERMQLREYQPDGSMASGALGTQVPDGEIFTAYDKIDVVLVPGQAFDRNGYRMGRGKGYYDRFLAMLNEDTYKIGVCFPYQMVENVPHEEYDIKVDYV